MIKLIEDTDLQALEANINGIIRESGLPIKNVDIKVSYGKDYFEDGRICNQWTNYLAIITLENQ